MDRMMNIPEMQPCNHFTKEKVYITPSPMGGGLHNPPTYETVYITP